MVRHRTGMLDRLMDVFRGGNTRQSAAIRIPKLACQGTLPMLPMQPRIAARLDQLHTAWSTLP